MPTDTTSRQIYILDENKVMHTISGGSEDGLLSLPILLCTADGTNVFGTVNEVFNGFGYIGASVWCDKDIKYLIPNGKNEDGTLKNIQTISHFYINNYTPTSATSTYYLSLTSTNRLNKISSFNYNNNTNTITPSAGNICAIAGRVYYTNDTITDIVFYEPLHILNYSTPHLTETYQNGTSWYRVWSDGWCEQGGDVTSAGSGTITFLKPFKDTNYSVLQGIQSADAEYTLGKILHFSKTKYTNKIDYNSDGWSNLYISSILNWQACGYIT